MEMMNLIYNANVDSEEGKYLQNQRIAFVKILYNNDTKALFDTA